MICKHFLPSCSWMLSLNGQMFFISVKSDFSIFFFCCLCFWYPSKNPLPKLRSERFTPMFSSNSSIPLALIFRWLIHVFVLFFVNIWSEAGVQNCILFMLLPKCPSTICWRHNCFFIEWSWHLCQKSVWCRCLESFLYFQFCTMGLYVYLYACSTLFWLL